MHEVINVLQSSIQTQKQNVGVLFMSHPSANLV